MELPELERAQIYALKMCAQRLFPLILFTELSRKLCIRFEVENETKFCFLCCPENENKWKKRFIG